MLGNKIELSKKNCKYTLSLVVLFLQKLLDRQVRSHHMHSESKKDEIVPRYRSSSWLVSILHFRIQSLPCDRERKFDVSQASEWQVGFHSSWLA